MQSNITLEVKKDLCRSMASNLSTLREKAKLSQEELAGKLGLSRQTISVIEMGKRDMQWSTFSVLIMFFANDHEIKKIMVAMGLVNETIEEVFNIGNKN